MALRNGLISHWKLEEGSGSRADSHGSHNLADSNSDVSNTTGFFGSGAAFPASPTSDTQLNVDDSDFNRGSSPFTAAIRVYMPSGTTGGSAAQGVLSKGDNSGNGDEPDWNLIFVKAGLHPKFHVETQTGGAYGGDLVTSSVTLSADTWYLIVVWYDPANSTIGIAVNNTENTSGFTPRSGMGDESGEFRVGAAYSTTKMNNDGLTAWDGIADEVSFWNRVLSSTERTALYNSGSGREGPRFSYALNFSTQPSNVSAGAAMSPSPAVEIKDESNARDTAASDSITLAIGTNPSAGTLSTNTNPLGASSGLATFNGTSINNAGNGYTLTADATDFATATSSSFNITGAAPNFPMYFRRRWRPHRRKRFPYETKAVRTVIIPTGTVQRPLPMRPTVRRVQVMGTKRVLTPIPGPIRPQPIYLPKVKRVVETRVRRCLVQFTAPAPAMPIICARLRTQPTVTRRTKIFLPPVSRTVPVPLPGKIKRAIEPRTRRVVTVFQTLLFRSPIFLAGKSHRRVDTRIQRRTAFVVVPPFPVSSIFMPGKTRRTVVSRTRRIVSQFPGRTLPIFLPGKKRFVEKTRMQRNIAEIVTRSPPLPIILPPRRTRSIVVRSRRHIVPVMMPPFPQTAIFQPGRRTRVVETRRQRCFANVPLRLLPTQPIALPRKVLRREVAGVRIRKFVPLPVAGPSTQSPVFIRRVVSVSRSLRARLRDLVPIASLRTVPLPAKRLTASSRVVITRRAVAPILASPAKVVCVPVRRIRDRVLPGRRVTQLLPTASAPLPIFLPPKRIFRTVERRRLATRTFPARLVQNVTVHTVKKTW